MNVIAVNDTSKLLHLIIKKVIYLSGLTKCGGELTKSRLESMDEEWEISRFTEGGN